MNVPTFGQREPRPVQKPDIRNMTAARIIIADPLELIADGLRSWLAGMADLELIAHVTSGTDLLALLRRQPCDLVMVEVSLPGMDGIDTVRALRNEHPKLPVLPHSQLTEIEYVNSMFIEGANGYLVKGASRTETLDAIRSILGGGKPISEAARRSMEQGYAYTGKRPDGEYIGLTAREREIIRLVALERTNGEIAAALFISEDTVKTHRKNLMTKLNVRSVAGLVKYAIDRHWI